jgi:ABC-type multidrug transport system ATPase subunit
MKISLTNAGKRFNRDWIFRNFTKEFTSGIAYAITGPNGSGKSTLLQVIGGAMMMSEGSAKYTMGNETAREVHVDKAFQHISIAAPYLELVEEMTLQEFLQFHSQFKPLLPGFHLQEIIAEIGLQAATHKQIRFYSSGMKQRVKLAQAIFSNVPCILLDEPCTNLDAAGTALYHQLVNKYCNDRLIIVSSNDEQEYSFCTEKISILDYKKQASTK